MHLVAGSAFCRLLFFVDIFTCVLKDNLCINGGFHLDVLEFQ